MGEQREEAGADRYERAIGEGCTCEGFHGGGKLRVEFIVSLSPRITGSFALADAQKAARERDSPQVVPAHLHLSQHSIFTRSCSTVDVLLLDCGCPQD
jgi:hypothetical protein